MAQNIPPELENELRKYENLRRQHESQSVMLQAINSEMKEVELALEELGKQSDDVVTYKAVGQVMFKVEKPSLVEELDEKQRMLKLRKDKGEKVMKSLSEDLTELQSKIEIELSKRNLRLQ